jgi:hypothetical protein
VLEQRQTNVPLRIATGVGALLFLAVLIGLTYIGHNAYVSSLSAPAGAFTETLIMVGLGFGFSGLAFFGLGSHAAGLWD